MRTQHALLVDFGSTYTKLRAVDLEQARIVASGQGPSTVTSDVGIGLDLALADLARGMGGSLPRFAHRLASSSAAGGLAMVTIGLVRALTAEAARRAALGAGAKLVATYAGRITRADVAAIERAAPDIVLLAGGTDGGNRDVILHNAERLAGSALACPIVVAGNREAGEDVAAVLTAAGKPVRATANVMPDLGRLDLDPARAAIRDVFIERIVHAKGIDRAADRLDAVLMPTPAAVLEGARLLAEGTGDTAGLGELLIVDVGGATTDVHSVATGAPSRDGVVPYGLPEPYLKRTVEGDLGMRHNAASIVEAAGAAAIAAGAGLPVDRIEGLLAAVLADVERLPASAEERAFDEALARAAVRIAVTRHAGTARIVHTAHGPATVQEGKDLTGLATVIGTGGPLAHGQLPAGILSAALADPAEPTSLGPKAPRLLVDRDYVLYAAGLLAGVAPRAAFEIARRSLVPVA
jgi:uncharacterized protein (TIGR01319 family)